MRRTRPKNIEPAKRRERSAAIRGAVSHVVIQLLSVAVLPVLLPWSLDALWFHMVLLGAGVLLRETDLIEKLYGCPWKIVLCGLIFFLVSALSGSGNLSVRSYGNHMLCYLAAALLGSVLAMLLAKWIENTFRQAGALIAFAGSHTMAVLCLHLFVFMLISGGYGVLGIDGSRNLWKLW